MARSFLSSRRNRFLIAVAGLLLAAVLLLPHLLAAAGSYLVDASDPVEADAVFVLAGDATGRRIVRAAELVRDGFAPAVIVSGPDGFYGAYECDLAIAYAVQQGFPEEYFIHFEHHAASTEEEADAAAIEVRKRGIRKLLIVTSNFHTRRALKQFRRVMPDIELTMVAAPDASFAPEDWWKRRQAQKVFFFEWTKTVATWFGI